MVAKARMQRIEDRFGLSVLGGSTIVAIVAVLVLVSLPRLRGFATTANEEDAVATSLRLASALRERVVLPDELPPLEELARDHLRVLTNAEFAHDGQEMRRHGYLFSLCRVPRPVRTGLGRVVYANDPEPLLAIVAWPWEAGRTGRSAWVATIEGDLLAKRNEEDVWSGPGAAPGLEGNATEASEPWSWEGWRAVR